jgi:hypothetical protein
VGVEGIWGGENREGGGGRSGVFAYYSLVFFILIPEEFKAKVQ